MADLEKLDNTIKELEKQSNDLKDFNAVYAEMAKLKQDILDNLKLLKENNEGLSGISKEVEKRLNEFQKRIDEIYKDNKAFQKELDASIATRLDKHKSDIQVEIRNEGSQIQRAFETALNSNFNEIEAKMQEEFERQKKQFAMLKILFAVLLIFTIGLTTFLLVIYL